MAQTWVLNERIKRINVANFVFYFKSNGKLFTGMKIEYVINTVPFYMQISYLNGATDSEKVIVYK